MSILLTAILAALIVIFFPLILAFLGVLFCLLMALLVWIKEIFFPGNPDK